MRYFLIFILFIILIPSEILAANNSKYILPYPSTMPGNIFYKLHLVMETFQSYWYFGNFSKFKFNLKQSDKYLVEAKTLFEYDQLLLGNEAVLKSDHYFKNAAIYLNKASNENKGTSDKKLLLKNAASEHKKVLSSLKYVLPESFVWQPENGQSTVLLLHENLNNSIKIRDRI